MIFRIERCLATIGRAAPKFFAVESDWENEIWITVAEPVVIAWLYLNAVEKKWI